MLNTLETNELSRRLPIECIRCPGELPVSGARHWPGLDRYCDYGLASATHLSSRVLGTYQSTRKLGFQCTEGEGVNCPGIWVVGDERGQEVVLGRNLLNRMRILLDGLAEMIEIVSY